MTLGGARQNGLTVLSAFRPIYSTSTIAAFEFYLNLIDALIETLRWHCSNRVKEASSAARKVTSSPQSQ